MKPIKVERHRRIDPAGLCLLAALILMAMVAAWALLGLKQPVY